MIDKKLGYSRKTQDLIDRQCRNVERKSFRLNKKLSEELLLKTYDLFGLKRPEKIVWCNDVFDEQFARSARSAWSAGSAVSAWSAWSAVSALDYDFDWYVFEFEYCQNPDKGLEPTENDYKYLEYCELLMQAKEAGLGYRAEWEDTLYLVPTPLVLIDELNRFHSVTKPAIKWKNGWEGYFLHGVAFDKPQWTKIIKGKITAKEILTEENMERRMAMLKVAGIEKILDNATLIDTHIIKERVVKEPQVEMGGKMWGEEKRVIPEIVYELYEIKKVFPVTAYYLKYKDPSTDRVYVSGIDPEIGKKGSALECMAWKFNITDFNENKPLFTMES